MLADDAGWKDSNPYGNPTVHTPNLRRLAESGVTFTRPFVTAPQCSPSRSSMLTGRYAYEIGAEDLHAPIPRGYRILPDYLREAGYFTGSMLKQHIGRPAARQFDWYSPRLGALPRFLNAADDRPFFLWVGFMDPHRPYANRRLEHVHNPGEITPPAHLRDSQAPPCPGRRVRSTTRGSAPPTSGAGPGSCPRAAAGMSWRAPSIWHQRSSRLPGHIRHRR